MIDVGITYRNNRKLESIERLDDKAAIVDVIKMDLEPRRHYRKRRCAFKSKKSQQRRWRLWGRGRRKERNRLKGKKQLKLCNA